VRSPLDWPEKVKLANRFLIAAGTAHYDFLPGADLSSVIDDLREIDRIFSGWSYTRVLADLGENPRLDPLRRGLGRWLRDRVRSRDDIVVIYYSGHGMTQGEHYLLCADSEEDALPETALSTDVLVRLIAQGPVQRVLVILDTCYASAGIQDMGRVAKDLVRPPQRVQNSGLCFIAAAGPKEEAEQHAFVRAFLNAVRNPPKAGHLQDYLQPNEIVDTVNQEFERAQRRQRAQWGTVDSNGLAPFIPNPLFLPGLRVGTDLESAVQLERLRRRRVRDLEDHFDPRARGVERQEERGDYFTGRTQILRDLVEWLNSAAGDRRIKVITGDPGSGKSAVLGRLVALGDRHDRPAGERRNDLPEAVLRNGVEIHAAIYARNLQLPDIVNAISDTAGIEADTPEELAAALFNRTPPVVIVVDGLDEAGSAATINEGQSVGSAETEPERIGQYLSRLAEGGGVRLIVGTRRHLLTSLRPCHLTDLDRDEHLQRDIADYALSILLAEREPNASTPYRDHPQLAATVAEGVAERASPVFLVARIVASYLAAASDPVDPSEPGWEMRLPADIGPAFSKYLEHRFDETGRGLVRRLLTPLAYAEGAGLPWDSLWAQLAQAISGEQCSDDAIAWLLHNAGAYVVESLEQNRSVYRLYHQALAELLRDRRRATETHSRFVDTLLRQVPTNSDHQRHWFAAHPYTRAHLASHAAASGRIDELVVDPGFLLAADPARLIPTLSSVTQPLAIRAAGVYREAAADVTGRAPSEAAGYLALVAHQAGLPELAERLARAGITPESWHVRWAYWFAPHAYLTFAERGVRAHRNVTAVAVGQVAGVPTAIAGEGDGSVRIWNLCTGAQSEPLCRLDKSEPVVALSVATVADRDFVVCGFENGTIELWDVAARHAVQPQPEGHVGSVNAIAVGTVAGVPVVVSGGDDGYVRVWNLGTEEACKPFRREGMSIPVLALALGRLENRGIAVCGYEDGVIQIWDIASAQPVHPPLQSHVGSVRALAVGEIDQRTLIVSGSWDASVQIWDAMSGTPVCEPHFGKTPIAAVSVTMIGNKTVQLWDIRSGRCESIYAHTGGVTAVGLGEMERRPIALTGDVDGTVKLWELGQGARLDDVFRGRGRLTSVTSGESDGHRIVVAGSDDGVLRIWDDDGQALDAIDVESPIFAVALGAVGGVPVIFSGSWDGVVRVWNVRTGQLVRELHGHNDWVSSLAFVNLDGRSRLISAGGDEKVVVWDLVTNGILDGPWCGHRGTVAAVSIGTVDGRQVVVTGSWDRSVRVWDLNTGSVWADLRGHEDEVAAVTLGRLNGRPIAVSGSWDGTVRVWDLRTRRQHGEPVGDHSNSVSAVAVHQRGSRPVIVAGTADGTVHMHDISTRASTTIRVGSPVWAVDVQAGGNTALATSLGLLSLRLTAT
jgi:WD40 repeat protein